MRDIITQFQNNIRGNRQKDLLVTLPFQAVPYWLTFEVSNETDKTQWYLDFGGLADNRTGVIAKLFIQDGSHGTTYFDGLRATPEVENVIIHDTLIPLTIKPNTRSIITIYLFPSDQKPLSLKPTLVAADSLATYITPELSLSRLTADVIPLILIASMLIMAFGFCANYNVGHLSIFIYYAFLFFLWQMQDSIIFSGIMGIETLPALAPPILALLVTLAGFLAIEPRHQRIHNRKIMMMLGLALILTTGVILSALPYGSLYRPIASYGISIMSMIGIMMLLHYKTPYNLTHPVTYLSIWIALFIAGLGMELSYILMTPAPSFFIAYGLYIVTIPQFFVAFAGITSTIQHRERRQIAAVLKRAEKAQSLLEAKKTKENSDQSKLLKVIEREREIMEELRQRELERAEEMRKAKVAADDANKAKSAFLAVVSHEIRTPMTGIMGMLRLLEETELSEKQQEYLHTISDSGDVMLALLNDILDFSKIESGGLDLENIPFDLNRISNSVIMLMKGHADQRHIALELSVDPDIPDHLYGDPTRLRQIFLNMIGNAIKFTEKGRVKLSAKIDSADPTHNPEDNNYAIVFSVEDTGIGISPEAQKNLFKPFSQADSSIARKYGGTGLGLAICKKLVEEMGGKIEVYSREGHGTRFYFKLIMHSADNNATPVDLTKKKPVMEQSTTHPLCIAVVDDNDMNRKILQGILEIDDHLVSSFEDGPSLIAWLSDPANDDPQVIFLDIEMPGMNGKDIARHIQTDLQKDQIPLVAVTGNVDPETIEDYIRAGFSAHVPKPIDQTILRDIIRNICLGNPLTKAPDTIADTPSSQDIVEDSADETPLPYTPRMLNVYLLNDLVKNLGLRQTQDLMNDLYIKCDELIPKIREAMQDQNFTDLRARAHELKGMCANFGLKLLSEKAKIIERTCKQDTTKINLVDLGFTVNELPDLFDRSKLDLELFFSKTSMNKQSD